MWLPDEPRPDRSLDLLVWGIIGASLLSALLLRDPFLLFLSLTLLLGACALALLGAYVRWEAGDPGRAIARAVRSLSRGEHPQYAIDSLEALELRGRPGLRLRIARRCLEASGRNRRLEWRLRREAVRWLMAAKDELDKETRV